ncbi:hypothetical protein AB1Y20_002225 [Prymnesium parvum]|uniref:Uncharacterized protein n=1 Tax=Prymnesium parvum TaxID=97485 RepID=A0AB34J8S0_PRYPA
MAGPSWREVRGATRTLVSLRTGVDSLSARITDLRSWHSCSVPRAELEAKLRDADIPDGQLGRILSIVQQCFDGEKPEDKYSFHVSALPDGRARLHWSSASGLELSFDAAPAEDGAQCVRDELLLPLLRAMEQLRQLVPEGTRWSPPADRAALPWPKFDDALLVHLLRGVSPCDSPPPKDNRLAPPELEARPEGGGGEAVREGGRALVTVGASPERAADSASGGETAAQRAKRIREEKAAREQLKAKAPKEKHRF